MISWLFLASIHLFVDDRPARYVANRYASDLYALLQGTRSHALYVESAEEFAKLLGTLKGDPSAPVFLDIMFDYAVSFRKGDEDHARLTARSSILSRNLDIEAFSKFKTHIEDSRFAVFVANHLNREKLKAIIIRLDTAPVVIDPHAPPLWIYVSIILFGAQFILCAIYLLVYVSHEKHETNGKWWNVPQVMCFLLWFPGGLPLVIVAGLVSNRGAFLRVGRRKVKKSAEKNFCSNPALNIGSIGDSTILLSKLRERLGMRE